MEIEFLVALNDNTWTTEVAVIPESLAKQCDSDDFEGKVLSWAHSPSGLSHRTKYGNVVMFGIYHYEV